MCPIQIGKVESIWKEKLLFTIKKVKKMVCATRAQMSILMPTEAGIELTQTCPIGPWKR